MKAAKPKLTSVERGATTHYFRRSRPYSRSSSKSRTRASTSSTTSNTKKRRGSSKSSSSSIVRRMYLKCNKRRLSSGDVIGTASKLAELSIQFCNQAAKKEINDLKRKLAKAEKKIKILKKKGNIVEKSIEQGIGDKR